MYAPASATGLKAVRRLTKRALRQRERAFLAEGPQAVSAALAAGAPVTRVLVTAPARSRHAALVEAAAEAGIDVHVVSGEVMDELAQTVTPQGVLAVCDFVGVPLEKALAAGPRLVAVLANVRDPGNAGTVLRAADAAGAGAVVFADASVDPYNGKCVRASAGSLFNLPVVAGTSLPETVAGLREAGLRVVAADGRADSSLDDVRTRNRLAVPTAWLFGNEAWGLPPELVALADESVAVPVYGRAESLNLAAAAAVCLYASAFAQRIPGRPGHVEWQALMRRKRVQRHRVPALQRREIACAGLLMRRFRALESDHIPSPAAGRARSWPPRCGGAAVGRRRR